MQLSQSSIKIKKPWQTGGHQCKQIAEIWPFCPGARLSRDRPGWSHLACRLLSDGEWSSPAGAVIDWADTEWMATVAAGRPRKSLVNVTTHLLPQHHSHNPTRLLALAARPITGPEIVTIFEIFWCDVNYQKLLLVFSMFGYNFHI